MAKALLPIIDGGRGFSCTERRIFDGYLYQRHALRCDKQTRILAGALLREALCGRER